MNENQIDYIGILQSSLQYNIERKLKNIENPVLLQEQIENLIMLLGLTDLESNIDREGQHKFRVCFEFQIENNSIDFGIFEKVIMLSKYFHMFIDNQ